MRKTAPNQIFVLLAIVGLLTNATPNALAVAPVNSGLSSSTSQIEAAAGLREDNLSPEEKFAQAKNDLEKALTTSLKIVDNLKTRLNKLDFPEKSQEQKLKNTYLNNLEDYAAAYNSAAAKLAKAKNLDELKTIAKEVKDYRDQTYAPGAEKIIEFVLVFYNEEVIKIANSRQEKIQADLQKLEKLGLLEKNQFADQLKKTSDLLNEATTLQRQAKELILGPAEKPKNSSQPSPKELIEQSLTDIKTVYGIFLELNKATKDALGL